MGGAGRGGGESQACTCDHVLLRVVVMLMLPFELVLVNVSFLLCLLQNSFYADPPSLHGLVQLLSLLLGLQREPLAGELLPADGAVAVPVEPLPHLLERLQSGDRGGGALVKPIKGKQIYWRTANGRTATGGTACARSATNVPSRRGGGRGRPSP